MEICEYNLRHACKSMFLILIYRERSKNDYFNRYKILCYITKCHGNGKNVNILQIFYKNYNK